MSSGNTDTSLRCVSGTCFFSLITNIHFYRRVRNAVTNWQRTGVRARGWAAWAGCFAALQHGPAQADQAHTPGHEEVCQTLVSWLVKVGHQVFDVSDTLGLGGGFPLHIDPTGQFLTIHDLKVFISQSSSTFYGQVQENKPCQSKALKSNSSSNSAKAKRSQNWVNVVSLLYICKIFHSNVSYVSFSSY